MPANVRLRKEWADGVRVACAVAAALILPACGGNPDGAEAASAPQSADPAYAPGSVADSSINSASADAADCARNPGGKIATVTLRVIDPQGNLVSSRSIPLEGAAGEVAGGRLLVPTMAGQYTMHLVIAERPRDGKDTAGPAPGDAPTGDAVADGRK